MIQNTRHNFFGGWAITRLTLVTLILLGTGSAANTRAQTKPNNAHVPAIQQPAYTEYRGVRVGVNATDVRTKLGAPLQKSDQMDFYAFSDTESAQIVYDAALNVKVISVDYRGGVGAPDYKLVVGADVEVKQNGGIYKLIRYDTLGVWVYYNRSGGEGSTVTITIQKKLDGF